MNTREIGIGVHAKYYAAAQTTAVDLRAAVSGLNRPARSIYVTTGGQLTITTDYGTEVMTVPDGFYMENWLRSFGGSGDDAAGVIVQW